MVKICNFVQFKLKNMYKNYCDLKIFLFSVWTTYKEHCMKFSYYSYKNTFFTTKHL